MLSAGILAKAQRSLTSITAKGFASMASVRRGLVLGIFTNNNNNKEGAEKQETALTAESFTTSAGSFNKKINGALIDLLNCSEPLAAGKCRVFYGLENYNAVAVTSLGKKGVDIDPQEQWHVGKENVRSGVAVATRALKDVGCRVIEIDPCEFPQCAAEGAVMSMFTYDELKTSPDCKKTNIEIKMYEGGGIENLETVLEKFKDGVILAEGQNLARKLKETPANLLTPVKFAETVQMLAKDTENLEVIARDKAWAEEEKMFSFLSVSQGSAQPPVFLEIHYKTTKKANGDKAPVILVGKGVCFDSGGLSLKPPANMDKMRADMGGAAAVVGAIYTLSRLGVELPFDVIALVPLVENMPGGKATKPGDVVFAKNGKSIKIDNTDAEGRLILADALCYADSFKPALVLDVATLTGAMVVALGTSCAGVFCSDDELWHQILTSSIDVGDRVWRLPLFKTYNAKMKADGADLNNIIKGNTGAGSCVAAGFLREFTECKRWAHIDIAGVMEADGDLAYIPKGMTGRPTRLLVHLLTSMSQQK